MTGPGVYRMTPMEVAWGYVPGTTEPVPSVPTGPPDGPPTGPREALERVIRSALLRPPCGVAFSGGRDSSVVLAVATHVARRDGLPDPVPITRVFPAVPSTEEDGWQELVVRHLGLSEWHRLELDDELDLLGPVATRQLRRHGVIWPPTVHGDVPLLEPVRGGSLLDGEGGDEVFGVEAHRIAPVTRLVHRPRPLRWSRIRSALGTFAPRRIRAAHVRRQWQDADLAWLRPPARTALLDAIARTEAASPLSFATSVRTVPRRRTQVLLARNRRVLARSYDVEVASPLLHAEVVEGLARSGGWLGRGDRTAVLRALVPDLLPDEVLARTSKTVFDGAFQGRHTRTFAQGWDGSGVDTALVDPEELRRWWVGDQGNALTAALLQTAWLETRTTRPSSQGDQDRETAPGSA